MRKGRDVLQAASLELWGVASHHQRLAPEKHDAIKCLNCGRVLDVMDTSPNMRASIAHSVASKLYGGDEYDEVRASVVDFFTDAIARRR